jgi:predicted hydrolase (HD superfamily)
LLGLLLLGDAPFEFIEPILGGWIFRYLKQKLLGFDVLFAADEVFGLLQNLAVVRHDAFTSDSELSLNVT